MRIDPKAIPTPPAAAGGARRAGAGQTFSLGAPERTAGGHAPAAAAPLATMDAILALQGEADPRERRRRAAKRGHDILDALDRLKAALLGGRVPLADLKILAARLAERRETTGDPRLDDLISHIELRAKVELAKLEPRRPRIDGAAKPGEKPGD